MKKTVIAIFMLMSVAAFSQPDSTSIYADSSITVVIPKKTIWAYAYYISESPAWSNRKIPDQLKLLIGSNNLPDSLINVSIRAGNLVNFLNRLQAERNEAVRDFYRSVLLNTPAIGGYTALQTQIINKANGNSSEKLAATYIKDKFLEYQAALQVLWNEQISRGLNWIKD